MAETESTGTSSFKENNGLKPDDLYSRARVLCQRLGETRQLFRVLRGLWNCCNVRSELQTAYELAEECLVIARRQQDATLIEWGHILVGITLFYQGVLPSTRAHLERTIAPYNPQYERTFAFQNGGVSLGVITLSYMTVVLWLLGYPSQAIQKSHETLALAHEVSQPFSLSFALMFVTWFHKTVRVFMKQRHIA